MQIVTRKRKQRPEEPMFIFQFEDEHEFEVYTEGLSSFCEKSKDIMPDGVILDIQDAVRSLKARTDGQYKTEDYDLSGMLFLDEMVRFVSALSHTAVCHGYCASVPGKEEEMGGI
jgi:hypothetical protein